MNRGFGLAVRRSLRSAIGLLPGDAVEHHPGGDDVGPSAAGRVDAGQLGPRTYDARQIWRYADWIGLRENKFTGLSPMIISWENHGKSMVSCKISLKPIQLDMQTDLYI